MLSYEKIILLSQAFAESHEQINEFGNGDLWEVVEKDKFQDYTFPLLWMQDNGSQVQGKQVTFSFNILVMDQVLNGEVNENFVKSSMHQILLDYLAYFDQTFFNDISSERIKFKIQQTANLTSFTERFNPILTGWTMSVTFTVPFTYNKCDIPLN